METINQIKQQAAADTPLLFFQSELPSGDMQYWSTHNIPFQGRTYSARILKHDLFDLQLSADDAMDGMTKLTLVLANADSALSQVNNAIGFKGTQLTVYFAFADLSTLTITSESTILFRGIAGDPSEITEDHLTLNFTNKLSLQRVPLPEVRVQRSCPWNFPATADQRAEAMAGGAYGRYSRFYRCGYSADQTGGVGNLNGTQAFTTCDKSRVQCIQRGMFNSDSNGNPTMRYGGFEFVPAAILVRTAGDKTSHVSPLIDNTAKYNDAVPIVYGTGWLKSPVVFARNDGNLTHMETLLGLGPIESVLKVIVNDIEIPAHVDGQDMSTTGWYSVVTCGNRQGAFNMDFVDSHGQPLGDPQGSIGILSVVVPNRISSGKATPNVEVLMRGIQIDTFNADGSLQTTAFSNNPAWVILDILRRSGWNLRDINLASFAQSAAFCQTLINTSDLNGNVFQIPRYSCNLVLTKRQSAAITVRGIRVAASLMLRYGLSGSLELLPETTLALQQPLLPDGSNSVLPLHGGWPVYDFSDGSAQFSGIARDLHDRSTLVVSANGVPETSNRLSVEFQDEFNEYQQDSLSLVNSDDVALIGYEISSQSTALGITNFSHATRVLLRQLDKAIDGNVYVSFVTSFRALKVRPGDLIALTYLREGFERTPFRVVKLSPAMNYQSVTVHAQIHDDAWYSDNPATLAHASRQPSASVGTPRPLCGLVMRDGAAGNFAGFDFQITEDIAAAQDGTATDTLAVGFAVPAAPSKNITSIPLLNLSPTYAAIGGTLKGNTSYYYAVSAVDGAGAEGPLSFTASVSLPDGANTYTVTLHELAFPSGAAAFNVYRGTNVQVLYRISAQRDLATQFVDTGLPPQPAGPPDASFDHANFYYRLENAGPFDAGIFSATTIGTADLGATSGAYSGMAVRISDGAGIGQERVIASNDATTLTVTPAWNSVPDSTSVFSIVEASWRFAAISDKSPAQFQIPYQRGEVIEICGRSANVYNEETDSSLCPITRWPLGGGNPDAGVAPSPEFVIGAPGGGNVTLYQVGFATETNTSSVSSGTLQLFKWNELNQPSSYWLAANVDSGTTQIQLNAAAQAVFGNAIQVGTEVMTVLGQGPTPSSYSVARGALGSQPIAHAAGETIYHLDTVTTIVPFARNFFENRASANYLHTMSLPDARIIASGFFVTNAFGNSQATVRSFATADPSANLLRTLSGGQFALQVGGVLATQQNAAPPLLVEASHAVRDIRATVTQAAVGFDISVQILQNGVAYGDSLTIRSGTTTSSAVLSGANLAPLAEAALLTLNVTLTPVKSSTQTSVSPGRDLTVTIRL